jgi:RNAse (barnase) inhibitor barstar
MAAAKEEPAKQKKEEQKPTFVIDGDNFANIDEFYDEVERAFGLEANSWGRNLDAFNDILCGDRFGVEDSGFILVWQNSEASRKKLGYEYRISQLLERRKHCHESWYEKIDQQIQDAENGKGETTFDELLEIIQDKDTHDDIELKLV